MVTTVQLGKLKHELKGELHYDKLTKALYATDASVYRRVPIAVALPKTISDLKKIIAFANTHQCGIIPRTAGTSLAGQCVGDGIVVDVSKYFTRIIAFDKENQTVTVEPGVIRDDLNRFLEPHGVFFGPNTSTTNRCMIGGMVGNNSTGSTSIRYGNTRDKVLSLKTILSDGNEVIFTTVDKQTFETKTKLDTLEGKIYQKIHQELTSKLIQKEIRSNFPKPEIHRRNTGYALDNLLETAIFSDTETPFNMCSLLSGSEGTLAFTTEITLKVDRLPPSKSLMIIPHFASIQACLDAVAPIMQHQLYTCEMLDKTILDLTKNNAGQLQNRVFIEGDPKAILLLEVRGISNQEVQEQSDALLQTLEQHNYSYANPILEGKAITQAMELRKAGLGLLGNMIGDKKAVACIEDTAVAIPDLAAYIKDFSVLMEQYNQEPVYYAHAGAGELHLRPILNLKTTADVVLFKKITDSVANLVKSYGGSMSGEHGDGIVRASYIPLMLGQKNYELLERIKYTFDPNGIFNPGKIVNAYAMDEQLRYIPDRKEPNIPTLLNFTDNEGILRLTEKCNGTGVCRRPVAAGGTMCPSYKATKDEKHSTRGRANALREILTNSEKANKFDAKELKEVFDLCLSCKGCASDCPSSVDVAILKAEFEHQYKKMHGTSLRTSFLAHNDRFNNMGRVLGSKVTNFFLQNTITSKILKKTIGIAPERSLPLLSKESLRTWSKKHLAILQPQHPIKEVYLFVDEFTNQLDSSIGIDTIQLLTSLNYRVRITEHLQSGRAYISKGFLKEAQHVATENVTIFKELVTSKTPLIGIEPSAILTFRDEYPRLTKDTASAKKLAKNTFLIDEFLANEIKLQNITSSQFTTLAKTIKLHGHCHQKALSNIADTFHYLNLPKNYKVTIIPSGCCGMAGSFGYEAEHYQLSMQIGEQVLFPSIRKSPKTTLIAATGTSCRHQIIDGTDSHALHPITILKDALIS